jgi:hypothetical protein
MESIVVREIDDQGDRVVLRGNDASYKIIASHEQVKGIKIGDIVFYEPYGWNFGWFKSAQQQENST